ncbi:hypothetical protein MMC30_004141 [Trapelia coarctata]|nr:hypothetical protein [Trapelia coarctata]
MFLRVLNKRQCTFAFLNTVRLPPALHKEALPYQTCAQFSSTKAARNVLSTLNAITSVKKDELEKQGEQYRTLGKELQHALDSQPSQAERIRLLLQGSSSWNQLSAPGGTRRSRRAQLSHDSQPDLVEMLRSSSRGYSSGNEPTQESDRRRRRGKQAKQPVTNRHDQLFELAEVSPMNLYRYYEQSKVDPTLSTGVLENWESKLRQALETQGVKHEYAALFGRLVSERLSDTSMTTNPLNAPNSEADDGLAEVEVVGRAEQHEQRKEWESRVFQKASVTPAQLLQVLDSKFGSPVAVNALEDLRDRVEDFCVEFREQYSFDIAVVHVCVKEVLKREILSVEQSATLKEIVANPIYLSKLADILNIRFKALDEWSWGKESIPVEMRRQLNGKYRVFMHDEMTQAIFLEFIGMQWSLFLKRAFLQFFNALAWTKPSEMTKSDHDHRAYFLEAEGDTGIASELRSKYESQYFMSQLQDMIDSGTKGYGDDNITKETNQTGRNPLEIKQSLLHLLFTESLMANRIHKGSVVVQSDFKWFGPSLPHATILTILKFFGVDQSWLTFFEKFLQAPLRFIQDGPNGLVQQRKCGIPMSHALSDVFGESVLFCLDYAVNQATGGAVLYRLRDDFWFWGQEDECSKAWTAITSFADVAGLGMNPEKTGAA